MPLFASTPSLTTITDALAHAYLANTPMTVNAPRSNTNPILVTGAPTQTPRARSPLEDKTARRKARRGGLQVADRRLPIPLRHETGSLAAGKGARAMHNRPDRCGFRLSENRSSSGRRLQNWFLQPPHKQRYTCSVPRLFCFLNASIPELISSRDLPGPLSATDLNLRPRSDCIR